MTNRDFFTKTWTDERSKFRKMLAATPWEQLEYRPHERSSTAGQIAWQIVEEVRLLGESIHTGEMKWEPRPRPITLDELLTAFDGAADGLQGYVEGVGEAGWDNPVKYYMNGQVFHTSNVQDTAWGFLFDLIHHRGQLSSYIRPMGGKVPGIYGPSADDAG